MSLTKDRNFQKFWLAQTMSLIGSQITYIGLPLIALKYLSASAFQIGILSAFSFLPFLIFGLPAGVWVDRFDLKWILIISDFARFILLSLIPILHGLGALTFPILCGISFMCGIFTLLFDIGDHSFLPQITENESELLDGNTKLYLTFSGSQMVGPALGGLLVQLLTAPFAILIDCFSYFLSGLLILKVKIKNKVLPHNETAPSLKSEIKKGLKFVLLDEYLRPLITCMAISNFFDTYGMLQAILVIFITVELSFTPLEFGAIMAISNCGAILGSAVNHHIIKKLGIGKTLVISSFVPGLSLLLLPLATKELGPIFVGLPLFLASIGVSIFNVNQLSLRQTRTPINFLGRMNATVRFLIWGTIPLGTFVGGLLAEKIGLRPTLIIAALGSLCAGMPVLFSKILFLNALPAKKQRD